MNRLFDHVNETLEGKLPFFNQLAKTVIRQKPSIDKKRVDIKQVLVPIIGYLCIHALYHAIPETNSLLRLNQLMALGEISEKRVRKLKECTTFNAFAY